MFEKVSELYTCAVADSIGLCEEEVCKAHQRGIVNLRHSSWMPDDVAHYPRYRFPPAIISHAVWPYYRFTLSFRDVEDRPVEADLIITARSPV